MSSQFTSSDTTIHDSRSSSPDPDVFPSSPLLPLEDDQPVPSPLSSPKSSVIASPPLDTRPYSPHGLGISILSPQPVLGPFAPITRANLSPLQVKSSPVEQRSNPLEPVSLHRSASPSEPLGAPRASGSRSPELPQSPLPPPPVLKLVEEESERDDNAGGHAPLAGFTSAGVGGQTGLRISIPPPNPMASTSTPSPPLFSQPTQDPIATSLASALDYGPSGPIVESLGAISTVDLLAPSADLNIDFTEFDTEGCSALEKIYLFSRSRASFHRVFIAHALPKYLLGAESSATELLSREIIEQITPGDAVEYVLPLLNGLAMDEDDAVKEALAAELVPIIWWFVTHCQLVEDDVPPPPFPRSQTPLPPSTSTSPVVERESPFPRLATSRSDVLSSDQEAALISDESSVSIYEEIGAPTLVSVQAFTPILGTLLLSPNGIVGGSSRYAVVELLRRLRGADQRDDVLAGVTSELAESTQAQILPSPVGSVSSQADYQDSGEAMDIGLFQRNERHLFERELIYQVVIGMGRLDLDDNRFDPQLEDGFQTVSNSEPSTAVPTPQPGGPALDPDSYFPSTENPGFASGILSLASLPGPTTESTTIDISTPSSTPSLSPSVLSASPVQGSPGHSSASTPPSMTMSSTSSSSGEYSDNLEPSRSDRFGFSPTGSLATADDLDVPMDVDEVGTKGPIMQPNWAQSGPLSELAALPTAPPFEVLPPPPVGALGPDPADATSPMVTLPILPVSAPSPARESPPHQAGISPGATTRELPMVDGQQQDYGSDLSEEAAVGRLSSMSLIAAVTASGSIGEDTKRAFVSEVERVGRDPVYWVRREASFAVGALAKVVPVEVVTLSLLPLFESLCHDPTWHVRHSVLFALPAILSRLSPEHRRNLALDVILPLSQDDESTVRSAVLEALGEVIYTFADDENGPPEPLLKLFLGIREIEDPGGGNDPSPHEKLPTSPEVHSAQPRSATSISITSSAWSDYGTDAGGGPDIYDDPQRPLVCAFNYPAVALTLGRKRWPEIRSLYLSLAQDPSFKIRRTLAASLGEMAKIIGEEYARADLMDVFWSSLRADESEVCLKAIEALQTFVRALARPERVEVVKGLEDAFSSDKLSSWREREGAVKALGGLVKVEGVDDEVLGKMLVKALDDRVAAVREAAVASLPGFLKAWKNSSTPLETLHADIRAFASSASFRRRTMYVTCIQEMLVSDQGDVAIQSETFWEALSALIRDPIVDVRIRVARLLGLISVRFGCVDGDTAARAVTLAGALAQDSSHEVRAFVMAIVTGASPPGLDSSHLQATATFPPLVGKTAATFSRPPPPLNPS